MIMFISHRLFSNLRQQTLHKHAVTERIFLLLFWIAQVYLSMMVVWYLFDTVSLH